MSEFDLINWMITSVNCVHAQCFNTTYQNKTFHDQRVVYNMAVDKQFYYCMSCKVLSNNVDVNKKNLSIKAALVIPS